jgi:DNA-binding LacI/PurR family transcriptional regulator
MLRPSLSTLASPYEQMGEVATKMLLQMIEGNADVESVALTASLNLRDSVHELK